MKSCILDFFILTLGVIIWRRVEDIDALETGSKKIRYVNRFFLLQIQYGAYQFVQIFEVDASVLVLKVTGAKRNF